MNIKSIKGKFYQEVDLKNVQAKLDLLKEQKANINYDALKQEYEDNVANLQNYEKTLDAQITDLESLLKNDE